MSIVAPNIQPATDVEASLRGLVRRDLPQQRRPAEPTPSNIEIKSFVQSLSGASIADVECTIEELAKMRDMLRREAERVVREIDAYASLAQAATNSMKVISDGLSQWRTNGRSNNQS